MNVDNLSPARARDRTRFRWAQPPVAADNPARHASNRIEYGNRWSKTYLRR